MTREMDYETIDWEAEAKLIAAAFGIEAECQFVEAKHGMNLVEIDNHRNTQIYSVRQFELSVEYLPLMKSFDISVDGSLFHFGGDSVYFDFGGGLILAEGFYKLGFLTPEIESELNVSVTAHEKLEWTLEHDERMKRYDLRNNGLGTRS